MNPHASLALHDLETPAEIDGLLDDYFHNHTSSDDMSAPTSSQPSLGESTKKPRVLYDDADEARRRILSKDADDPLPQLSPNHDEMPSRDVDAHDRFSQSTTDCLSAIKPEPLFSLKGKGRGVKAAIKRGLGLETVDTNEHAHGLDGTELQQMPDSREYEQDDDYCGMFTAQELSTSIADMILM